MYPSLAMKSARACRSLARPPLDRANIGQSLLSRYSSTNNMSLALVDRPAPARPPALPNPHPAPADAPTKETRAAGLDRSPSLRTKELVSCDPTLWQANANKVYMLWYEWNRILISQWHFGEKQVSAGFTAGDGRLTCGV